MLMYMNVLHAWESLGATRLRLPSVCCHSKKMPRYITRKQERMCACAGRLSGAYPLSDASCYMENGQGARNPDNSTNTRSGASFAAQRF